MTTFKGNLFSADGPVSLPATPTKQRPVLTEFMDDHGNPSGWGFTSGGICIVMTQADREEMFSQFYAPPGGGSPMDPMIGGGVDVG